MMIASLLHARRSFVPLAAAVAAALLAGCASDLATAPADARASGPSLDRAGYDQPGVHRQYGPPQHIGDGLARTYVVLDAKAGNAPIELGIALDARALDGLPTSGGGVSVLLALPQHAPAPYQFAELDWNPEGHPPAGVYTVPHFDFHFYTISLAERNAIVPSDPQYAAEARNLPTGAYVPPFYVVPGDPAEQAVPQMGVHWFDVRAPELQAMLGNPGGYRPFTATFIYGSWNGRFTFVEPMVSLAYLLTRPDVTMPISVPAQYAQPGYYPTAYRVTYDAQTKQYLVALADLVARP